MIYRFQFPLMIKGKKFPNLNDYIHACGLKRRTRTGKYYDLGWAMKQEKQRYIATYVTKHLRGVHIEKPIRIHYHYFLADRKEDFGNVHATVQKFAEDALQDCKVIKNDNQAWVVGFTASFEIDKDNPRCEVELEEIE